MNDEILSDCAGSYSITKVKVDDIIIYIILSIPVQSVNLERCFS